MGKDLTKLYRSTKDKKLSGLCGGLAESFNVDPTLLRLVVVVTTFFSGGTVIPLYILSSIVIPKEPIFNDPFMYGPNRPVAPQSQQQYQAASSPMQRSNHIDEMMKDIEKKALQNEINQLRAKVAQYEKGEV